MIIESSPTRSQIYKTARKQKTRRSNRNISSNNRLSQMKPDNSTNCNLAHVNTLSRPGGVTGKYQKTGHTYETNGARSYC